MDPTLLAILGIALPILLVVFRDKPIIKSIIIGVAKFLNIPLPDSYTGSGQYKLQDYIDVLEEMREMCQTPEILAKLDEIYTLLPKETQNGQKTGK